MCCDICDYYFRCDDTENESALCCGKCDDQNGCHGTVVSRRYVMDNEDDYDDLLDDTDDYDDEDDEEDDDYDEDDYDDSSIH